MTQGYCEVRTMLMHGTPETIKKKDTNVVQLPADTSANNTSLVITCS